MRISIPWMVKTGPIGGVARLFLRDRSATSGVEFALISVPFLGLLFAIFQTSLLFLMQQGLKAATDAAARQVLTGQAQNNNVIATWQDFRDALICPPNSTTNVLPSFIPCSSIIVDVRKYTSFSATSSSSFTTSFLFDGSGPQYNPGGPCDIIVVRAVYPMPVFLPILSDVTLGKAVSTNRAGLTTYNGNLVQLLTAAAVFRNEPYVTSGSTTSGGC